MPKSIARTSCGSTALSTSKSFGPMKNGIVAARDGVAPPPVVTAYAMNVRVRPAVLPGTGRSIGRYSTRARSPAGTAAVTKILILDAGEAELALVARLRLDVRRRQPLDVAVPHLHDARLDERLRRPGCSRGRCPGRRESSPAWRLPLTSIVASTLTTYRLPSGWK